MKVKVGFSFIFVEFDVLDFLLQGCNSNLWLLKNLGRFFHYQLV
jgi:hypothetical protein